MKKREKGFICKQCGNCCLTLNAHQISVGRSEVKKWRKNPDIMSRIRHLIGNIYDVWFSPVTGDEVDRYPWLRKVRGQNKYRCRIQEVKPCICANYPFDREHAERTKCQGYNL